MRKVLESCPACGGQLDVTRMTCRVCDTVVEGTFAPCRFCRLSPESLHFVTAFVRNRGNLKEMERELGLSYPTLRGRLDEVLRELGFEPAPEAQDTEGERSAARRAILTRLDAGELSASEAADQLSELA